MLRPALFILPSCLSAALPQPLFLTFIFLMFSHFSSVTLTYPAISRILSSLNPHASNHQSSVTSPLPLFIYYSLCISLPSAPLRSLSLKPCASLPLPLSPSLHRSPVPALPASYSLPTALSLPPCRTRRKGRHIARPRFTSSPGNGGCWTHIDFSEP